MYLCTYICMQYEKFTSRIAVQLRNYRETSKLELYCIAIQSFTLLPIIYLIITTMLTAVCQRLHEVVGNPERLYADYSFKGLNSKQQKTILSQLKGKPSSEAEG